MSNLSKILCIAEAMGELDSPTVPKRRKYWVHPLNIDSQDDNTFNLFFDNIKKYPEIFLNFYRMSISSFEELVDKVRHRLSQKKYNISKFNNSRKKINCYIKVNKLLNHFFLQITQGVTIFIRIYHRQLNMKIYIKYVQLIFLQNLFLKIKVLYFDFNFIINIYSETT